jgi:hypothetical protein
LGSGTVLAGLLPSAYVASVGAGPLPVRLLAGWCSPTRWCWRSARSALVSSSGRYSRIKEA